MGSACVIHAGPSPVFVMSASQNSVFEGEMTPGDLKALKQVLAEVIDPEHDSVLFYVWRVGRYASRGIMGVERGARSNFV